MNKLSPAALAVKDAIKDWVWDAPCPGFVEAIAAAALRAAAEQASAIQWPGQVPLGAEHQLGINWTCDALHAIANELEAQ